VAAASDAVVNCWQSRAAILGHDSGKRAAVICGTTAHFLSLVCARVPRAMAETHGSGDAVEIFLRVRPLANPSAKVALNLEEGKVRHSRAPRVAVSPEFEKPRGGAITLTASWPERRWSSFCRPTPRGAW